MEDIEKDMKPRLIEDLGIRRKEGKVGAYRYGLFECQYCNKEFEAQSNDIKKGNTKSCGCFATHGLTYNKFYNTWNNMIQRCSNPNNKDYIHYGARGIIVCEEWMNIRNFVDWTEATHPNIEGVSLDRIDNDKGYSPENCTWSDKTAQILNQRIRKDNTSGFVGVRWHIRDKRWIANIGVNNKLINLGSFPTIEEAVQARDNYIIENNLPHKLSKDYKRIKDEIHKF